MEWCFGCFPKLGAPSSGAYNRDCSIRGPRLGSPYLVLRANGNSVIYIYIHKEDYMGLKVFPQEWKMELKRRWRTKCKLGL